MPIDQAKRLARLRHNREGNRMSVRILRLLNQHPYTTSQLWEAIYPDKKSSSENGKGGKSTIIAAMVGRISRSFMGTLITGEGLRDRNKHWKKVNTDVLWSITDDGREYLRVYDTDPQRIIDGERDSRLWLQANGRRFMSRESIENRKREDASIEVELGYMRETSGCAVMDARTMDIMDVYAQSIRIKGNHCYRITAGRRQLLRM